MLLKLSSQKFKINCDIALNNGIDKVPYYTIGNVSWINISLLSIIGWLAGWLEGLLMILVSITSNIEIQH